MSGFQRCTIEWSDPCSDVAQVVSYTFKRESISEGVGNALAYALENSGVPRAFLALAHAINTLSDTDHFHGPNESAGDATELLDAALKYMAAWESFDRSYEQEATDGPTQQD